MQKIIRVFILAIAITCYVSSVHAQSYAAYLKAGDESFDKNRFGEALEYYTKASEFETGDLYLVMRIASSHRMTKDYERAATWYGRVLLEDKQSVYPEALFYFAEMKRYLGMYEESARVYERYLLTGPADSSYMAIKARTEIASSEWAAKASLEKPKAEINNAGPPVNSNFSEFGASMLGDTTLYFSSLKFLYEKTEKKEDAYYVSRILKSKPGSNKNLQPVPLGITINEAKSHNCNAAFSPDYRFMIFSRCNAADDFSLDCRLLISKNENGTWSKPVEIQGEINMDGFTSTQPAIGGRGAEGYTLFFVSDRPGGKGKLDIWKSNISASGEFSPPENAGEAINTFDDEMSPFYYTPGKTLYFSSYGHPGFGGMDIFKSVETGNGFTNAEHLGAGYNSSFNDVYFTVNRDTTSGTLSSNRFGSMYLRNKSCCYDIYYYKIFPPVVSDSVVADTIAPAVAEAEEIKTLSTPAYYDDFLPLQLYFDNDEPDRRSNAITTIKDYESLYQDYISSIPEYREKFSANLTGNNKEDAIREVDGFFNDKVTASRNLLVSFCEKLEKALKKNIKIELEIRGRASPLAKDSYNINLSKRRISSLRNFMLKYNEGVLVPYLNNGDLVITEVAAGETLAKSTISDELKDKRNSVYNPAAAVERRIELINIKLTPPGQ